MAATNSVDLGSPEPSCDGFTFTFYLQLNKPSDSGGKELGHMNNNQFIWMKIIVASLRDPDSGGVRIFNLRSACHRVQIVPEIHSTSFTMNTGSFLEVKLAGA